MPDQIRVFVNDRGFSLAGGTLVRDAIRAGAPDLFPHCEAGHAKITDARGLPMGLDDALVAGSILRVVKSSRRGGG
jgi:hypothetical protein